MSNADAARNAWDLLLEKRGELAAAAIERNDWPEALDHARELWLLAASQHDERRERAGWKREQVTAGDLNAQEARHLFRSIVCLRLDTDGDVDALHLAYGALVREFDDRDLRDEAGFALLDYSLQRVFEGFVDRGDSIEPLGEPPVGSFDHKVELWAGAAERFRKSRSAAAAAGMVKVARVAGRNIDAVITEVSGTAATAKVDRLMEQAVRWLDTAVAHDEAVRFEHPSRSVDPKDVTVDDVVDALERWAKFRKRADFPAAEVARLYSEAWPRLMLAVTSETDIVLADARRSRSDHLRNEAERLWEKAKRDVPALGAAAEQHPAEVAKGSQTPSLRLRGQDGGIGY
ncbi:MAG: hypothetical protein ACOYNI_03450 [Acidimicrobiia bacterium]